MFITAKSLSDDFLQMLEISFFNLKPLTLVCIYFIFIESMLLGCQTNEVLPRDHKLRKT